MSPSDKRGGNMPGRRRSLVLGLAAICSTVAWVLATDDASIPRVDATAGATERPVSLAGLPLAFEANRGQVDDAVEFLSRTGQSTLFLTRTEAVLSLPVRESRPHVKGGAGG